MATTYSPNLALNLMATGDQAGTWSITNNLNLGTLIEQAISGATTQAIADSNTSPTTLTMANGVSCTARNMYITLTGTLTANRQLIVPTNTKIYIINNQTTGGYAVTVLCAGMTGISVANGQSVSLFCNGTDITTITTTASGTYTGTLTGCTTTPTATMNWALSSSSLIITSHVATSGVSNSPAFTVTGGPIFYPTLISSSLVGNSTPYASCYPVFDGNGLVNPAWATYNIFTGVLYFYLGILPGNACGTTVPTSFGTTSNKGLYTSFSVSFPII